MRVASVALVRAAALVAALPFVALAIAALRSVRNSLTFLVNARGAEADVRAPREGARRRASGGAVTI